MSDDIKKAIDQAEAMMKSRVKDLVKKSMPDPFAGAIIASERLVKARVKAYQRTTASGKMVQVKEHTDSRQAAMQEAKKDRPAAKPDEKKAHEKPQQESKWPAAAAAAQDASRTAEDHDRKMDINSKDSMVENSKYHREAAMKNLEAFHNDAGTDVGRQHYYKASSHLGRATANLTFHKGDERVAANTISSMAESVSKIANKHVTEQRAASLDYGSGMHLLAAEQHMRAAHAHQTAYSRHWDDDAARSEHNKKMAYHQAKAKEHGTKAKEIADITVKASDKARVLGDNAKTTEDHIAASLAHKEAAKLNYDSEGRAEHEKMAKYHAGKAKAGDQEGATARAEAQRSALGDRAAEVARAREKAFREGQKGKK